jgi:uncharacterized protein (DUF3820 family)
MSNRGKFTDESIMPYGKYKGRKMANIPGDYLIWLFENNKCCYHVSKYIQDNMEVLKSEINK